MAKILNFSHAEYQRVTKKMQNYLTFLTKKFGQFKKKQYFCTVKLNAANVLQKFDMRKF